MCLKRDIVLLKSLKITVIYNCNIQNRNEKAEYALRCSLELATHNYVENAPELKSADRNEYMMSIGYVACCCMYFNHLIKF